MYYGTRLGMDYKKVWLEGMKDWSGQLPDRMTDDALEEEFWRGFVGRKAGEPRTDDYAATILNELLPMLRPEDSVLEIGPGWGNYTFTVAQHAGSLSCLDSSSSVLSYLQHAFQTRGQAPFTGIHGKWESSQLAAKSYDVVFGINCYYRMQDIDRALLNMDRTARRLAIAGMTSGPEQPHYWDIHQTLGYRIRFARRDYIHLTNVLYQHGIDVNCKMVNLEKTYVYDSEEELFQHNISKIMDEDIDRRAVERIIAKYSIQIDGKPAYVHRFKAALLYWEPEQQ